MFACQTAENFSNRHSICIYMYACSMVTLYSLRIIPSAHCTIHTNKRFNVRMLRTFQAIHIHLRAVYISTVAQMNVKQRLLLFDNQWLEAFKHICMRFVLWISISCALKKLSLKQCQIWSESVDIFCCWKNIYKEQIFYDFCSIFILFFNCN